MLISNFSILYWFCFLVNKTSPVEFGNFCWQIHLMFLKKFENVQNFLVVRVLKEFHIFKNLKLIA